jgi:signal transduction histidine kinase
MPQMFGNLSIHPKMVVLLAVPVAGTALLAVTGVAGAWGDRTRAAEERREAAAASQALVAVHELQEERIRAVAWAAGEGGQGELGARRRRVDSALAAYRAGAAALGPTGDPALDQAVAVAAERLDRLAVVRAEVDQRLLDPERASATHDALVSPLLGIARGLAAGLDAPVPAQTARMLLAGTLPAGSSASTRVRLAAAAAVARHEIDAVRAAAGERLAGIDRVLGAAGVRTIRDLELRLLQPDPDLGAARDLGAWRDGLAVRAGALRRLERTVAGDLDAAALASLRQRERRLRDRLVMAGAAGIDLVHLLAELLDNAVAFSPPTAPIVVTGGADGDGYLIEVTDRGLGMSSQEQAWANHRLASAAGDPGGDQAAADRLGLLVVARLAAATGSASGSAAPPTAASPPPCACPPPSARPRPRRRYGRADPLPRRAGVYGPPLRATGVASSISAFRLRRLASPESTPSRA